MVSWPWLLMKPPFLQVLRSWWVKASSQVCLNEATGSIWDPPTPSSVEGDRWRFIPVTYSINDSEIASPKGFFPSSHLIFDQMPGQSAHLSSFLVDQIIISNPKKPGDFICCLFSGPINAPTKSSESSGFGASQFYLLAQSWNLADFCDRKRTFGISPKQTWGFFSDRNGEFDISKQQTWGNCGEFFEFNPENLDFSLALQKKHVTMAGKLTIRGTSQVLRHVSQKWFKGNQSEHHLPLCYNVSRLPLIWFWHVLTLLHLHHLHPNFRDARFLRLRVAIIAVLRLSSQCFSGWWISRIQDYSDMCFLGSLQSKRYMEIDAIKRGTCKRQNGD